MRAVSEPHFSCISYSFRRDFDAGRLDLAGYFALCRDLGITALDPWGRHLAAGLRDAESPAFETPDADVSLDKSDLAHLDRVRAMAAEVGLPFGCVAPDGPTYVYEPEPWKRDVTRRLAERWITIGGRLGVRQMRFDPGRFYDADVPDDVMRVVCDGYRHLVAHARPHGIEILIENHWGCAGYPAVVTAILDRVEGLGCLFDTFNFAQYQQAAGWLALAPRATATHVKATNWVAGPDGWSDLTDHLAHAVRLLADSGYAGVWGIESTPQDGTAERDGVERTMDLIRRSL